jgi:uncharacterized protein YheU (UPF0270 family)
VIVVPVEELSEPVVSALIEEFVTRHGAIQGEDVSLDVKVAQVRRMLKDGRAVIVWDDETESATVVTKEELKKWDGDAARRVVQDEPDPWHRRREDEG